MGLFDKVYYYLSQIVISIPILLLTLIAFVSGEIKALIIPAVFIFFFWILPLIENIRKSMKLKKVVDDFNTEKGMDLKLNYLTGNYEGIIQGKKVIIGFDIEYKMRRRYVDRIFLTFVKLKGLSEYEIKKYEDSLMKTPEIKELMNQNLLELNKDYIKISTRNPLENSEDLNYLFLKLNEVEKGNVNGEKVLKPSSKTFAEVKEEVITKKRTESKNQILILVVTAVIILVASSLFTSSPFTSGFNPAIMIIIIVVIIIIILLIVKNSSGNLNKENMKLIEAWRPYIINHTNKFMYFFIKTKDFDELEYGYFNVYVPSFPNSYYFKFSINKDASSEKVSEEAESLSKSMKIENYVKYAIMSGLLGKRVYVVIGADLVTGKPEQIYNFLVKLKKRLEGSA